MNMDLCNNTITMTGILVNKRMKDLPSGSNVLSLYVRTKDSRGAFFNIAVDFWGKKAVELNNQLNELLPNVDDGDRIAERDTINVTVEGELRQQSWVAKDGKRENRSLINGLNCKFES